ncbi:MAG: hypothetical protein AB1394_02970 [Bacteroidota bacterium]
MFTIVISNTSEIGADCILLSNGHYDRKLLETLGVPVLDSINELL